MTCEEHPLHLQRQTPMRWGEKRYYALNYYLRERYGQKMYKLSLNGGMTCPNRDGTLDTRGCIFCSAGGSGDFAGAAFQSVAEQLKEQKALVRKKYKGNAFIAYFQAFTNTYAPYAYLEKLFTEAISDPEVAILSIATRPDCLSPDILELLCRLNKKKPVWIELGLQTIHEDSADFIRRGYPLAVFEKAVSRLRAAGIDIIVHVILYLPGETEQMMLQTISYLNTLDIQGIKLQLLHVLKGTDLAVWYEKNTFHLPGLLEYASFLGACISTLRPDIVVHRLTGDGPKPLLIEPLWTGNKRLVLNTIEKQFREQHIWQGKAYFASN